MYKVMIIDDEQASRNLLKMTIQWSAYNMVVAGEAESGIEAINTIDEIQPDIAFVDIRMPFMDGIEFSKLAIKRYPNMKIIILTAFNDFEYARKCVGIGICEYILKPIVRNEIHEVLAKVEKDLNERVKQPEPKTTAHNSNNAIDKIKAYLCEHYQDSAINLTSLACTFGFNASYLSRLFKTETGQNLIDYLTQLRMEKAKILAKQGKAMYITAQMVGIPDPNYFGKCFKKYTDMTYTEYAKG